MTERYIEANGIRLAYDEFGDPSHPAMVLIMGLGTQMIAWPEAFCQGLAARGYRVIRFDNRDIGLSQKMQGQRAPGVLKLLSYSKLNLPLRVPYTLQDMAQDAVGLLDALEIEHAHIVGASMGGMIAQLVAGHHPQRVLSLTSVMSTSGHRSLPGPDIKVAKQMLLRPRTGSQQELIDYTLRTMRLIGSPAYQPTEEELLAKLQASYQRSYYPAGYIRQMAAIQASGDRVAVLKKIVAPTLVVHGRKDLLVPLAGGIDTARHIRGARLEVINGMGHDLPAPLLPHFVQLIGNHADEAVYHKVAG
jgi:pimeloyl-ACP methyl ester carboxylesterase